MKILSKFCIVAICVSLNFAQNLGQICVTIEPVRYFSEKIAGDDFKIISLVAPNADPHTYEPKPAQMQDLARSVAYFGIGSEFDEAWQERFSANAKNVKFYDLSKNITKQNFGLEDTEPNLHTHAHEHDHAHDGDDPHIWLDPILVKQMSENITQNLCEIAPNSCAKYEQNLAKFQDEIDEIHAYATQKFAAFKGAKFIIYHPTLGYFAHRYDLEQIAIEEGGSEPKPAHLTNLIKLIKDENLRTIFVSPQNSVKSAEILAKQTGAKLVFIDFLGYNWQDEMKKLIDEISSFKAQK